MQCVSAYQSDSVAQWFREQYGLGKEQRKEFGVNLIKEVRDL